MGAWAAVRAAEAQPERREAAAEEPILLRGYEQTRVRSTLIVAAKLEGPPALHRRAGSRHAGTIRDEPPLPTSFVPHHLAVSADPIMVRGRFLSPDLSPGPSRAE